MNNAKRGKVVSYNKWGYIFLIPFVVVYAVFQLIPLVSTFYNSFFENYRSGLTQIGPNFVGFKNFATLFTNGDLLMYTRNTMIMWILGFVPQIIVSLLLGAWFSDPSLRLKGQRFFKTVIYLPNLIMASAFSMLFFTLFADSGPINSILISMGIISGPFKFMSHVWSVRGLVDGATATQIFYRITLPLLRPILLYVMITSLIGGLQMFDVPQILTNGTGDPVRKSMTLIMYLNKHLWSKNYGMGGALSVLLFIITGIFSFIVFKINTRTDK